MIKKTAVTFILILVTSALIAQPVYTAADFGNVGSQHRYSQASAFGIATIDFNQTGPDHLWDFTSLSPESQEISGYLNPEINGFRESFIVTCISGGGNILSCINLWNELADMSETSTDTLDLSGFSFSNQTEIYSKDNNAFTQTIMAGIIGFDNTYLPVALEMEEHDTLLQFPFTYQSTFSSRGKYTIDLTDLGQEFIYRYDRSSVHEVDGYGTMETPWKSYSNVLKIKTTTTISDSLIVNGSLISNPLNSQIRYQWYSPSEEMVILAVEGYTVFGGFEIYTEARWLDTIRCLNPSAVFATSPFFPALDPQTNESIVTFLNFSSNADEYAWNFGDPESGTLNTSFASSPEHIYTQEGTYNVELVVFNNVCSPVLSDTLVLPVVISDTVSTSIDIFTSGYKIFPNPVTEYVEVEIPESNDIHILLYNGQGVIKKQYFFNDSQRVRMDLTAFDSGVYFILIFVADEQIGSEVIIKK